jgi:hypothetical protein
MATEVSALGSLSGFFDSHLDRCEPADDSGRRNATAWWLIVFERAGCAVPPAVLQPWWSACASGVARNRVPSTRRDRPRVELLACVGWGAVLRSSGSALVEAMEAWSMHVAWWVVISTVTRRRTAQSRFGFVLGAFVVLAGDAPPRPRVVATLLEISAARGFMTR